MSKNKTRWVIPPSKMTGVESLANGQEASEAMVGAYYGSSLEYNLVMTPQYCNAGEVLCPTEEEVRRVFKPKRPYGTFGALISDEDQNQYQFEGQRCIVEIQTAAEADEVATLLETEGSTDRRIIDLDLRYRTKDNRTITYEQAVREQNSYRDHNSRIQKEIDEYIAQNDLEPKIINGRKVTKRYTDEQLSHIAALARKKKSVTGFNVKLQLVGKHTIAKNGNFMSGGLNQQELDSLASKFDYRDKTSFRQGIIRHRTIVIPVQTISQLKAIKECVDRMQATIIIGWPERVKSSCIKLEKASIDNSR